MSWQPIEPDDRGRRQLQCTACGLVLRNPVGDNPRHNCGGKPLPPAPVPAELAQLAGAEAERRGMLAGDLMKRLFAAIGIPPCDRCKRWAGYLNQAHAWLRGSDA